VRLRTSGLQYEKKAGKGKDLREGLREDQIRKERAARWGFYSKKGGKRKDFAENPIQEIKPIRRRGGHHLRGK